MTATRLSALSRQKRCALPPSTASRDSGGCLAEIVLHDVDGSSIRRRDQANRPIGANHQPIGPERFERDIEIWDDLFRLPVLPVRFGDQS